MKRRFEVTLITLLGLALVPSVALAADHGHGRDHDRDEHREARDHDGDRHHGRGDRDDDRDERPGWSHGKKEGWKKSNCDLPPGLAKKNPDCGEARHRDRDRDHDRDRDRDRDRDHDRVVVSRTPTQPPARPRPTSVRPVPTNTVTKKPTHKIRNPAEMIDPKTGTVRH